MKSKSVQFNGPQVRAARDGRRTAFICWAGESDACPYGSEGSELWLREAFAPRLNVDPKKGPKKARHYALYRAEFQDGKADAPGGPADPNNWHPYHPRWTPARDMPQEYSRWILTVTEIRRVRLQEVTPEEAAAHLGRDPGPEALAEFREEWIARSAKRPRDTPPWETNPRVWVVSFKIRDVDGDAS